MDFREMNLAVFQGRPIPHVFFQPRFEPWYAWHQSFHCMPNRYQSMDILEMYDHCQASMRYMNYYIGLSDPIEWIWKPGVTIDRSENSDQTQRTVVYRTPKGDLIEQQEKTVDGTWRTVGFPVKTREDLISLGCLYRYVQFHYNHQSFQQGDARIAHRGSPTFWVPKSPYQALAQQWMKMEDLVYALADFPEVVEETMRIIDDSYDSLYEQLASCDHPPILNFGENLHEQLFSPLYFEKYFQPFYQKRCGQLHKAGIYTHIHIDGYFRHMLPYLKHFPHHGIEALTPVPQGDMTLEEIKEHLGDKILLDGIPAILFMDNYSRETLMQCVEQLVKLFHPRLILGVSDEVPEGTGEEAIERVRMIGQWCRKQTHVHALAQK